jgi:hypothetical protein
MTTCTRCGLALAFMILAPAGAGAQEVRVGFDGVYRTGSWTPLTVEFSATDGRSGAVPRAVHAWVEDPDGQYVRSPAAPVEIGGDGRPSARLTVRFGRPSARVLIEPAAEVAADGTAAVSAGPEPAALQRANVTRHSLPAPLPAAETVMLVLGDLPAAERASRLQARDDGSRPRVVPIRNTAAGDAAPADGAGGTAILGQTALDFDGADSIVVCGRAVAGLDPTSLRGIDDWVRQGGRLVLAAGTTAADIDRAGGPAAAWLPGRVAKLVPLRRGNALETYARANRPLDKGAFTSLEVPLLADPQAIEGSIEAFEGRGPADLPLVVRRAYGLGTIVWAGIDLDRPPFRDWSGSDSMLVEMLLGRRATRGSGRTGETRRGSLDLAGQLRQAIDRFSGVTPIPFEVIAGLGILYVACLYPLDWWLVSARRMTRAGAPSRSSWLPWLSLPLVVAAASGLAWSAGQRWKGSAWQTSAAGWVDLDVDSGLVRAASFAGVWSPLNARLDVMAGPDTTLLPIAAADVGRSARGDVSWFAPCGRGIGGTDAASPHPSLAAADYGYGGSAAVLDGVPIAASSSRLFEAETIAKMASPAVDSTLAREGQGTLRGEVTSRLPFALEDCVLAHAGWLYDVGTLEPGQTFAAGVSRGPRSLAGALTHRTANKDRDVAVRWDVAERDPLRVLEIAGLHAAAGGSGYTSLEPGRLARFDLSPLLPLDRAVLMGRGPAFVAWECRRRGAAEADDSATVPPLPGQAFLWRIVIPLVRTSSDATSSSN